MSTRRIAVPRAETRDVAWWDAHLEPQEPGYFTCPVCNGHRLKLDEGEDGKALLHCFNRECSYGDIVAAVDDPDFVAPPPSLSWRRARDEGRKKEWERMTNRRAAAQPPAAVVGTTNAPALDWLAAHCGVSRGFLEACPVEARPGAVAFTFGGGLPAKIRKIDSKEFAWEPAGAPVPPLWPMPYPLPDVARDWDGNPANPQQLLFATETTTVILTEGETDCIAWWAAICGSHLESWVRVFALTKGAGQAPDPAVFRALADRGVNDVILAFDADGPGKKGAVAWLSAATEAGLRATIGRVEGIDALRGEKDARDVFRRAGDLNLVENEPIVRALADLAATIPTDVRWVVQGLVFRGGVTLLAGPAKGGKTTLVENAVRCVESGQLFLGSLTRKSPVLLLSEEGAATIVQTFVGASVDVVSRRDRVAASWSLPEALGEARDWLADNPGGLIVIDTLAAWAGIEDENDAATTTKAVGLVAAALADGAVILVHHTRKGGGDYGEAIRGSSAILASVDIAAELTYVTPGSDRRHLTIRGRFGGEDRRQLDFDRLERRYHLVDAGSERDAEVQAWLAAVPEWPTTSRILQEEWGLSERSVRERCKRLVGNGYVREVSAPGRVTVYHRAEPPVVTFVGSGE